MTEKPISINFGTYTMNLRVDEDFWKKFTELARDIHGHGGVKKVMLEAALEWYAKYEGKSGNIEQFFDQQFIPEPMMKDSVEDKVKWMKTQNNDILHKITDDAHKIMIFGRALQECEDKKNFNMQYMEAWSRYK